MPTSHERLRSIPSPSAGIVAEGRDITTVVAPDAEVRILLTAREEVRQARRSGQAVSGVGAENVAARDKADSKVTNFTSAAEGVLTVDNSDLNFGETLDVLVRIVDDAIEEQEYRQYVSNLEGYELDEGDEELIDGTAFSGGEARMVRNRSAYLPWSDVRTSANPLW